MKQTGKIKSCAFSHRFAISLFPFIAKHTKGGLHAIFISYQHLLPQFSLIWSLISPLPFPAEFKLILFKKSQ